eukprot:TRINITY_DN37168_c0_g1_i1.p1 TRINITY_DN37168_c0_g1~~TRINITY_DN37168_c0_g1_i1.p1  ORF type:complete len:191 (-),score=38.88 TRINITY_DN37168_c0_g1_i1:135-707(-)
MSRALCYTILMLKGACLAHAEEASQEVMQNEMMDGEAYEMSTVLLQRRGSEKDDAQEAATSSDAGWEEFENLHPDCCNHCSQYCSPWSGSCKSSQGKPYYQKCKGTPYVTVSMRFAHNGKGGNVYVPLDKLTHRTLHDLKLHMSKDMNLMEEEFLMKCGQFVLDGAKGADFATDGRIYPGQKYSLSVPDL